MYISKFRLLAALSAAGVMGVAAQLSAQTDDLADRFGSRGSVLNISMSPSGKQIAYIAPGKALEEVVYILDLDGNGVRRPIAIDANPNGFLYNCDWANEKYLLCNFRGTSDYGKRYIGFDRLMVVATDGSGVRLLDDRSGARTYGFNQFGGSVLSLDVEGKPNSILMERVYQTAQTTGTRTASGEEGVGIEEVNLDTLYRSQFLKPRPIAIGYLTDEKGEVRIMGTVNRDPHGYVKDDMEFAYLPKGAVNFDELLPDLELEEFNVVGVDSGKDVAYALGEVDGFSRLYTVALNGTGKTDLLLSQPGFDIDSVIRIGRKQRIVGASFAGDRRHIEYFDTGLKKLSNSLNKALPGTPMVEIIGASADEQRLLILAHSDINPGMVYLFDRGTSALSEIMPMRGELEKLTISPMRLVRYTTRDGVEVPAYLTLPPGSDGKNLPTIVMPHGGPEARDEWGFDWLSQYYAQRGFAVLQPNYRGSAGYGAAWRMENGFQSWRTAIADVADAGNWLVKEGIARKEQLAVVGWSYGGYAALQAAAIEPDLFKAVVAIAPVTDLGQLRDDARNYTNYPIVSEFLGHGSEIIDEGSPARRAAQIAAPVMLVHGEFDEQAPYKHSELMADALKDVGKSARFLQFPGMDHSLRDSAVRARMLRESDAFLRESMGMK